jgi:hypothetical protein
MPRPHPNSEQREAERQAACAALRKEHGEEREHIQYNERRKKAAESERDVMKGRIEKLRARLADVSAKLNAWRSRAILPFVAPAPPCPRWTENNPRASAACELARVHDVARRRERERRRLEDEKASAIRALEAEVRRINEEIATLERAITKKQEKVDEAKDALHYAYLDLSRIENEFEANGCGKRRDLWPF